MTEAPASLPRLTRRAISAFTLYRRAPDAMSRRQVARAADLAPAEAAALDRLAANLAGLGPPERWSEFRAARGLVAADGTGARVLAGLAVDEDLSEALTRACEPRYIGMEWSLKRQLEEAMKEQMESTNGRVRALIAAHSVDATHAVAEAVKAELAALAGVSRVTIGSVLGEMRKEMGVVLPKGARAPATNGHGPTPNTQEPAPNTQHPAPEPEQVPEPEQAAETEPTPALDEALPQAERLERELARRGLFLGEMISEDAKREIAAALGTTLSGVRAAIRKARDGRGIGWQPSGEEQEESALLECLETAPGLDSWASSPVPTLQTPALPESGDGEQGPAPREPGSERVEIAPDFLVEEVREMIPSHEPDRLGAALAALPAMLMDLGLQHVEPEALRPVLRELALAAIGGGGER